MESGAQKTARGAISAWLLASVYYLYQYALRSAPGVMVPQLSDAFGLTALGVSSLVGLFYFGYSPFSLVAGASLDRFGARTVIPVGAFTAGLGALLFGTGHLAFASAGRFLQGAGGVFALVGAVYIASKNFPASRAATLVGATQMFGMAGGSAGQFLVGPAIAGGLRWNVFWLAMGAAGIGIAALLYFLLPRDTGRTASPSGRAGVFRSLVSVFRNPQSVLCGLISGLLFVPTTIFDMVWGVRFLQDARGFDYGTAVLRSSMVPLGWIIGCPLLGMVSDRMGRRKPVIIAGAVVLGGCMAWILYGKADVFPPYSVGLLAGIASGAAMLPYTVIKEANPPQYGGTATGVINFINFTFSALLGPVFGAALHRASGGGAKELQHYQITFEPLMYGVIAAIALTLVLKETGPRSRSAAPQERLEEI